MNEIKRTIEKALFYLNLAFAGMCMIAISMVLTLFYAMIIGAFFDGDYIIGLYLFIVFLVLGSVFWVIGYLKSNHILRSDQWKAVEEYEKSTLEKATEAAAFTSIGLGAAGKLSGNETLKDISSVAAVATIGLNIFSLHRSAKRIKTLAKNMGVTIKTKDLVSKILIIGTIAVFTGTFAVSLSDQIKENNEIKDLQQQKADILEEYLSRSYVGSYGNKIYGYLDDDNYVIITLDDAGEVSQVAYSILPEEGTFEYMCAEANDVLDDFSQSIYAAAGEEFDTDNAKITNSICEALQDEDYYIIYDGGFKYYYSYDDEFYISVGKE